jgi:hypothetical protein
MNIKRIIREEMEESIKINEIGDYYHKWLCNDLKCGGINQNPGLNKNETNYYFTIDEEGTTLTPIRYI